MASPTALVAMLNRLGGRTDGVAASRDLITLAPARLPIVLVEDHGETDVRVSALNVEELMSRRLGEEPAAMALLGDLVRAGAVREPARAPGTAAVWWSARDARDVARQTLQWALDHPEADLTAEAFLVARAVLDA